MNSTKQEFDLAVATLDNAFKNKHLKASVKAASKKAIDNLKELYRLIEAENANLRVLHSTVNVYDLVVIGGGSGGIAAAKEAARYGKTVAVLDFVIPSPQGSKWGLGGTCVNVGCIPKKLMHQAALLGEAIHDAKEFGWDLPESININWRRLVEAVQNHIKSVNWTTRVMLRDKKIDYTNGYGHFVDPYTVSAILKNGSEKILKAEHILIATGGRPTLPEIPGAKDLCITTDDIFSMRTPPGKTLIIGAGYIGVECAGFLRGLGFDVTVMVRSIVLRGFDQQMASLLTEELIARGVRFLFKCVPLSFRKTETGKILAKWKNTAVSKEGSEEFETVLMAIGRKSLPDELKAQEVGIELDNQKVITKFEQTNVPSVFAVGDILQDKPELTPVAIQAGKLLAARLFGNSKIQMDYENVPTVIFAPLEYGCLGLTEVSAQDKYGEDLIEVYHAFFKPLEYLVSQRNCDRCYLKVVCLRKPPQKVLGMHYLGPEAGEVIQGFAAAIRAGLNFDQLQNSVGIHPTCAEEFTRLHITKRSGDDPKPQSCCS